MCHMNNRIDEDITQVANYYASLFFCLDVFFYYEI